MGRTVGSATKLTSYPVGTLKLTAINPKDFSILESKMFKENELPFLIDEAVKNYEKNYLVFKLLKTDGTSYSWQLLPYGSHLEFKSGIKFYKNSLHPIIFLSILSLAIYGLYKIVKR